MLDPSYNNKKYLALYKAYVITGTHMRINSSKEVFFTKDRSAIIDMLLSKVDTSLEDPLVNLKAMIGKQMQILLLSIPMARISESDRTGDDVIVQEGDKITMNISKYTSCCNMTLATVVIDDFEIVPNKSNPSTVSIKKLVYHKAEV